ncbi:MAG: MarR family transcriptional regulator [Chthoniobacterales bacterium]|nr:MarR family transcriptional regulator [Chthoniobacterales bacterium]
MNGKSVGLTRLEIERLADIIMALQRCFVQHLSEELSRGQVSFSQFFLLGHIATTDSLSMTEIAEKMSHTTAAATGLVDRLENLGYVERMHASNDRRKVLVSITPKGGELVSRIRQDIISKLTLLSDILEPEEQTAWLQIYEKIYAQITCSH